LLEDVLREQVLFVSAGQDAVQARLQGTLPALRPEPQQPTVPLR